MHNVHIWETHGIHVGTGIDHVKHGINDIEAVIEEAIERSYPNITFVIHTPRLTHFRYHSEKSTDIKFIRGDQAYADYADRMNSMKKKYGSKINIKYGVELEWLGAGIGMSWNRAKVFQVPDADFIIGSVHFSKEGLPYDGSESETNELVKIKGGVENYWGAYIEDLISMIDSSWGIIQVVGHIDLPKLYVPTPEPLINLDSSKHFLARRMHVLLERIRDYNLAIDVNLAGLRKGCGIYPALPILKKASELNIPIAFGTDGHGKNDLGADYEIGISYALSAGHKHYVSFSNRIPQKRALESGIGTREKYKVLNMGIELLNKRFDNTKRHRIPRFSFGGSFCSFLEDYQSAVSLGNYQAIRIGKENKSITLSDTIPVEKERVFRGLFSRHKDIPGTLSILFSTLGSEGINIETAYLNSNDDGTATACLTLTGSKEGVSEAVEFLNGTLYDRFFEIKYVENMALPEIKEGAAYLLEVDGADIPIALSGKMILTLHDNSAGVLLILLSALASRGINVNNMQLGKIGERGCAVLCVDGEDEVIEKLLAQLGPQYHETSFIKLNSFGKSQ